VQLQQRLCGQPPCLATAAHSRPKTAKTPKSRFNFFRTIKAVSKCFAYCSRRLAEGSNHHNLHLFFGGIMSQMQRRTSKPRYTVTKHQFNFDLMSPLHTHDHQSHMSQIHVASRAALPLPPSPLANSEPHLCSICSSLRPFSLPITRHRLLQHARRRRRRRRRARADASERALGARRRCSRRLLAGIAASAWMGRRVSLGLDIGRDSHMPPSRCSAHLQFEGCLHELCL
jgi:hypothetical protein